MTSTVDARRDHLEQRLREYHDQDLSSVLETLDHLTEGDVTVIAGGSLSIGQGNRESDLDVVIVGPEVATSAVPLEHWAGSLRIDAWTRSQADVDALFGQAEAALAADGPIRGAFGDATQEQQLKLLHRIVFGVVVVGDPVRPATATDARGLALSLLTREYTERARESVTVAGLARAAGRDLLAATVARVAVEEALHAELHRRGTPFSGDKWLAEQVLAEGHADLRERHERVAVVPAAGEPLAGYVEDTLTLAHELLGLDRGAVAVGLTWRYSDLTLLPLAGEHVLVHAPHGAGWVLETDEARAWRDLGGATASGSFSHPGDDEAAAALCVRLYEAGVLRLDWETGLRPVREVPA